MILHISHHYFNVNKHNKHVKVSSYATNIQTNNGPMSYPILHEH